MESLIFPDAKAVARDYLAGHLPVNVVSRVPKTRPEGFVRLLNAGGAGLTGVVFSEVALTVESWDNNEATAASRAQLIRDLLRRAHTMAGHPVYGYTEWGPPVDLPDESEQYRYVWTFTIRMRPVPN